MSDDDCEVLAHGERSSGVLIEHFLFKVTSNVVHYQLKEELLSVGSMVDRWPIVADTSSLAQNHKNSIR